MNAKTVVLMAAFVAPNAAVSELSNEEMDIATCRLSSAISRIVLEAMIDGASVRQINELADQAITRSNWTTLNEESRQTIRKFWIENMRDLIEAGFQPEDFERSEYINKCVSMERNLKVKK